MPSVPTASELVMRPARRSVGLVRALGVALALAAGSADPAAAEVLIGVAGPSQGPSLATNSAITRGVAAAVDRINANGGIRGEPVVIAEADDDCTATAAEKAARDLVARGVKLVVGHPCTAAAIAAAKIYAEAGVVFIAPVTRHPALTSPRAGPTIFRLAGRDDTQGRKAGDYLASTFPGRPLALVADGSRMADDLVRGARAALKDAGRDDVLTAHIEGGEKDYTKLIAKLQAAGTAAVFFAGFPIEGGLLLRQMRAANLNAVFLGSDALANGQLAETAGADRDRRARAAASRPCVRRIGDDPARPLRPAATVAAPSPPATPRSKPGPRPPPRRSLSTERPWPRPCRGALSTPCWGTSPSTTTETHACRPTISSNGRTAPGARCP